MNWKEVFFIFGIYFLSPICLAAEAVAHLPDSKKAALINVELGLGYLADGQVARAKPKFLHALKIAPKIPETHSAMAYFMERVGDYQLAEKEYKKAVSLSKQKGPEYNNYATFLCRRGRLKEADQIFTYALEDKEYASSADVYENAGLCALKDSNNEKASEYLATAVRRDPNRRTAILELIDLDLKQGKIDEAKNLLKRYKAVAEPSARSLWLGIQVSKVTKDEVELRRQATLLKNLFQDSPEYQMYLKSNKKQKRQL